MDSIRGQLEQHIHIGEDLDIENADDRNDWIQRSESLLRRVDAHEKLQDQFEDLDWSYHRMVWSPGVNYAQEDAPRHRSVRAASKKAALRILRTALDELSDDDRSTGVQGHLADRQSDDSAADGKVFIVYGHDHALRA